MRSLALVPILILVLFAAAWPAAARPREYVVAGRGVADPAEALPFGFDFTARGTPKKATGEVSFQTLAPEPYLGDVKCLAAKGKRAAISGKFRQSTPNGDFFLLVVKDNGPAQDPPLDTLHLEPTEELVPCRSALHQPGDPIRDGDIRVRRARA